MSLLNHKKNCLGLREKNRKLLNKNLTNERKKNKRLEDSLKTNDSILFEIEESFTSENRKVNDLTKKLSLVEDTRANLKSDNEKLQESLTSLQAIHTALEVEVNTLLESFSKACESSKSYSPSTSNTCA
jgi:chromosome segregation ATPase